MGALDGRRGTRLLRRCEAVEELEAMGVLVGQGAERWKEHFDWNGIRTQRELQVPQLTSPRIVWISRAERELVWPKPDALHSTTENDLQITHVRVFTNCAPRHL